MPELSTILAGAACAAIGSAFPAILFEKALREGKRAKVNMALGLASIFSSFVLLTAAQLAVYRFASEKFFAFGCAMVAFFLLIWAVEAIRAWKSANGGASGPEERKERK
ncbi:hypothetical protein [Paratractidigestivibacter sp.]|uniref:hypothetical protein n=1 Tax=Paratractidigestivibacter sp. TaxID=2847316 RepID=UPI002ABE87E2|nr:hypothetical protein [Paratractidigestivibacter sp.]